MKVKMTNNHSGTSQQGRFLPALASDYVAVEERNSYDLLKFCFNYANYLHYINEANEKDGNWQVFFEGGEGTLQTLAHLVDQPDASANQAAQLARYNQPHIVMLLAFLYLLRYPLAQFKAFTERHLNYYYRDLLGIAPHPDQPDQAHVTCELASSYSEHLIARGTLLSAGKDSAGKPLHYAVDQALVVNKASLAMVKTLAVTQVNLKDKSKVKAIMANTAYDSEAKINFNAAGFKTFGGESQAKLGFALSSPVLLLTQGSRTINLQLLCKPGSFSSKALKNLPQFFDISLSSAEGWMAPSHVNLSAITDQSIELSLQLDPAKAAVVAPDAKTITDMQAAYPIIKFILKQSADADYYRAFEALKSLALTAVNLEVKVSGLTELITRTDSGVVRVNVPFELFGHSPKPNSGFYFTHQELATKNITSLSLTLDWLKPPKDFASYYQAYTESTIYQAQFSPFDLKRDTIANASFTAAVKLFNRASWQVLAAKQALFSAAPTAGQSVLVQSVFAKDAKCVNLADLKQSSKDPLAWQRYFKLELGPTDFQHDLYPMVLNEQTLKTLEKTNPDRMDKNLVVNAPYTPQLSSFTVDYTAVTQLDLQTDATADAHDQLLQIQPFGQVMLLANLPVSAEPKERAYLLLPDLTAEGYLYVGIKDILPNQTLALLFQMAPNTADPTVAKPEVSWSYLSANQWLPLTGANIDNSAHEFSDTTNGLLASGIVRFKVPQAELTTNQVLPSSYFWLRACVGQNSAAIADTVMIKTQALSVTLVPQANAADHFSRPLPANSITKFVKPEPAISKLTQPCASFNGRPAEANPEFTTRVSERLRHKQRALSTWDFERLVLEQFPQIYKVKCLNQIDQLTKTTANTGKVSVIVVPKLQPNQVAFSLTPRAPLFLLAEIKQYLQQFVSPFISIEVKNPSYLELSYVLAARFVKGADPNFYKPKLEQAISKFLAPWAFDGKADIQFGHVVNSSALVQHLEQLPFVEFIANLRFRWYESQVLENGSVIQVCKIADSLNVLTLEAPDRIIVSATSHAIKVISDDELILGEFKGIGHAAIGLDFYLGVPNPGKKDAPDVPAGKGIGYAAIDVNFYVSG